MPINKETRILKSNTIEELRQKANEVSLHVGDDSLIDSRILDKTESFTAAASQKLFTSNTLRFELKPEETIDRTSESVSVGLVRVFKDGVELTQGTAAANFLVPNFVGSTVLNGLTSGDVDDFIEDRVAYQGSSLANATWQGKILDCTTTLLRFKTAQGTFSASTQIKVDGQSDTIAGTKHAALTAIDQSFGNIIQLNTAASSGDVIKIVSTNVVDALNEIQDDVGDITAINAGIPVRSDIVLTINSFKGEVGNAADLTPAANTVVGAINEHETDIGTVANLTTSANDLVTAINEHDAELGTISAGAFGTSASTVSTAIAELHTDVDARLFLTKGSQQTLNSDITFSNGNTLVFPSGSTLDIRNGLLQTGSGGIAVSTAFIDFNSDLNQRGLSFERSDFGNGADVKLIWDEAYAASQPDRAFRVIGLNTSATTQTADLVTFYNAQDLITNNAETGIDVTWDSTNQNFDFALSADPTITLGGDLTGSATLTNLTNATLTATIAAGSVENSMLAGSIAASKLAGSIGNSKLTNSTITVTDGSNSTAMALGSTITFQGTSGEVEVSESSGTVTVGLPNNITVGGNLTVTGNLDVNGTQTTLNTATLEVDDTLVLMGASNTEPTTGGFGLETRAFTGTTAPHSNAASNVTGTHSIVYNFATDQWEADGSLILSEATQGVPGVKVSSASNALSEQDLGQNKAIDFNEGSGITLLGAVSGNDIDVTITNSDKGSDQFIFRNIAVAGQSTIVADSNDGQLNIVGAGGITPTTNAGTDTLTLTLANSGVSANTYGSQFVVPRFTVNAQGRITSVTNQTAISLSALGYTGASNADNFGSFSIKANSGSAEAIGSGETITFTDSGATTVSRSGNTIDISSTNTVTSVGTSGNLSTGNITFVGGSNASVSKSGGTITIAATDTNTVTNVGVSGGSFTSGNIDIRGTGATTVSKNGNIITINSTDNNTDTNTITSVGTAGNLSTGNITLQGGGSTSVSKSGGTITISSSDNNTVTTNVAGTGVSVSSGTGNSTISIGQSVATNATVQFGLVRSTGDVVAFYSSDERLKDNITPIENSLDKVGQLKGYEFDWNDKQDVYEGHDLGVIAQEVEKVAPELVQTRDDGYKAVKYEKVVPLLINAINELKAEIEELKSINKKV